MSQRCRYGSCGAWAIRGGAVCNKHGGSAGHIKNKAKVRAEIMNWGLGDTNVDPGQIMLRLVSQSSARCDLYAGLLQQAYDAAERLGEHADTAGLILTPEGEDESAAVQQARDDFNRVFKTGGVGTLVGNVYSASATGSVYATGEAIRGLVDLEMRERKLCADFASKAIAAGLGERLVRLAEKQGEMIASVLRAVLGDPTLGLTGEQAAMAPMIIEQHVNAILE